MAQVSPLVVVLRGILRDYSQNSLLNEMLQNADDAYAKEFKVCLDCRTKPFGAKTVLGPEMVHFQGPAYVGHLVEFIGRTYTRVHTCSRTHYVLTHTCECADCTVSTTLRSRSRTWRASWRSATEKRRAMSRRPANSAWDSILSTISQTVRRCACADPTAQCSAPV